MKFPNRSTPQKQKDAASEFFATLTDWRRRAEMAEAKLASFRGATDAAAAASSLAAQRQVPPAAAAPGVEAPGTAAGSFRAEYERRLMTDSAAAVEFYVANRDDILADRSLADAKIDHLSEWKRLAATDSAAACAYYANHREEILGA